MQENDNLVQLQDENGKDVNFEHLMTIEHEGNYYVVLEATEDTDDCKEGEAIILKIVRDDEVIGTMAALQHAGEKLLTVHHGLRGPEACGQVAGRFSIVDPFTDISDVVGLVFAQHHALTQ